ncbi:MAG: HIT domain-containing protein [Bryobacteraceae bacterium]|nr:HIT domain-containing protein [Bryobacteraceae bacterium]
MERIFSPWRSRYVQNSTPGGGCIFCDKPAAGDDEKQFIVLRAERNFVLLNVYPYTSGHVMIAPYEHVASLEEADPAALAEMMQLARRIEAALRVIYKPSGINLGMNIGQAAGAGVAGHIHLHVLPRWFGDVNFMTTVAETRVIPEDLEETYRNLRGQLAG